MKKQNINEQIFKEHFNYQSPLFLVRDFYEDNKNKNNIIVKYLNESLIDLRNSTNSKEIPEHENPKKVADIVEKILDFNKQQKGKGLPSDLATFIKILTPKQMLQRLPIALAQVKASK